MTFPLITYSSAVYMKTVCDCQEMHMLFIDEVEVPLEIQGELIPEESYQDPYCELRYNQTLGYSESVAVILRCCHREI